MADEVQKFTLGVHVKLGEDYYLPVRFVKQSTLHEETASGTVFIDEEEFVELRDRAGKARFVALTTLVRTSAKRDPGPCKGIKPYYWKEPVNGR